MQKCYVTLSINGHFKIHDSHINVIILFNDFMYLDLFSNNILYNNYLLGSTGKRCLSISCFCFEKTHFKENDFFNRIFCK